MVNKWINNILVMVYMDLFLRQTAVNTRNGIPDLCVNGFIWKGEMPGRYRRIYRRFQVRIQVVPVWSCFTLPDMFTKEAKRAREDEPVRV